MSWPRWHFKDVIFFLLVLYVSYLILEVVRVSMWGWVCGFHLFLLYLLMRCLLVYFLRRDDHQCCVLHFWASFTAATNKQLFPTSCSHGAWVYVGRSWTEDWFLILKWFPLTNTAQRENYTVFCKTNYKKMQFKGHFLWELLIFFFFFFPAPHIFWSPVEVVITRLGITRPQKLWCWPGNSLLLMFK